MKLINKFSNHVIILQVQVLVTQLISSHARDSYVLSSTPYQNEKIQYNKINLMCLTILIMQHVIITPRDTNNAIWKG